VRGQDGGAYGSHPSGIEFFFAHDMYILDKILLVIVSISIGYSSTILEDPTDVTAEYHGRVVVFRRTKKILLGRDVDYFHKGIIFIPREYDRHITFFDSRERYISYNKPYVIHFWHPGPHKSDATIRIDRLEDIILGDPWQIVDDPDDALPTNETIDRAISKLGHTFRDMPYRLAGNNCGNFVAWCKTGEAFADKQFPNRIEQSLRDHKLSAFAPVARTIYSKYSRKYAKADGI
jgi:hypothetical protein